MDTKKSLGENLRIWASPLGGFSRNRVLRRALRDYEKGLLGYGELEELITYSSLVIIGAQISAGMSYVVDGMLDWHDMFRPFVSVWRNVTPTSLLRYFDNNFFYRVPLFTDKPEAATYIWAPRVRKLARFAEPAGFKVVLPGPVTFVLMSKNESGLKQEELAESIAEILATEARLATEAGAALIQVDEPMLTDPEVNPDFAVLASELVSKITSAVGTSKTVLALYYGAPRPDVYEKLIDARVSCISVDVGDAPGMYTELLTSKGFGSHCAILGLVNSRTLYDEPLNALLELAIKILREYGGEEVGITTTTWLDLIPYDHSLVKVKTLDLVADRLASLLGSERLWGVVKP